MHIFEVLAHLFHPRRSNNHRPKILHAKSIFSLALLAVGVGALVVQHTVSQAVFGDVLGYASDITVQQVVAQTNSQRSAAGLGSLTYNETLSSAARLKAADMFAHQYWSHTSPQGLDPWYFFKKAGYNYQSAGENLARDFGTTPEMMAAWMASPTHKANIVHARYEEIGVAVVNGTLQGVETTLVVQLFGKPKLTPAVIPSAAAEVSAPVEVKPAAAVPAPIVATPAPVVQAPTVLAEEVVANQAVTPFASPVQLLKAVFEAILVILLLALIYDAYIIQRKKVSRMVGHNAAHIAFLLVVFAIVLWVKSGTILTGIGN